MKKIHIRLLSHTIVLFAIAQLLAIVIAGRISTLVDAPVVMGGSIPLTTFLAYFAVGTLVILLLTKLYRGHFIYRVLFLLALCTGLVTVYHMVFPLPISLFVSIVFCIGLYLFPIIWVHNIAVIIASAGLGALLGLQLSWEVAAWLLIVLSVYDIFAVFVTGHMIHLAKVFIAKQASFALIIPESWYGLYDRLGDVRPSGGYLILGGGDVILPMLLSIAIAPLNFMVAMWVVVGSMVGLIGNHIVLMKWQRPIPALPMIAIGSLVGLFVGFYV